MDIQTFEIKNLYGTKDIKLTFKDNTLILVGENGAGKTTVLRLMFYFLSGQWDKLGIYNFESLFLSYISNTGEKGEIEITKSNLNSVLSLELNQLIHFSQKDDIEIMIEKLKILDWEYENPVLSRYMKKNTSNFIQILKHANRLNGKDPKIRNISFNLKKLKDSIDFKILYLPTYRRIETELDAIISDRDEEDLKLRTKIRGDKSIEFHTKKGNNNSHIELIEFGMNDVKTAIENTLKDLKEFSREQLNNLTLGYLSDVVEKKYNDIDISQIKNVSKDLIESVLQRIDIKILSDENKNHLSQIISKISRIDNSDIEEHSKVLCHYFLKLLNFQKELEKREQDIKQFCEICNKFLNPEKKLDYDSSNFTFRIFKKIDDQTIELKNLSSGEKQIVSIFNHLCLSNDKKAFFVLIDEPELSLSVKWQKEFLLNLRNLKLFKGMFSVTHSPFIYDNELVKYASGLGVSTSEVQ